MGRNGFRVFDAHCHIYPEKIAAKAVAGTDRFYGSTADCLGTVPDLLERSRAAGIDGSLVHSVATTPKQVKSINEFIAREVAEYPDLLVGFGTLHPESETIEEDVRHLVELGLQGVKVHPDIQGFQIDLPQYAKMYDAVADAGLVMLMHTGDVRYDNSNPNRLIPLLKRHPTLKLIGAHFGGWSIWEQASIELAGTPNFWVDCSSSLDLGAGYDVPDSGTPYIGSEKAREIIDRYGADRVLFGTDFPMWEPGKVLDAFFDIPLSDADRKKILWDNAAGLLGFKK